jgi:hypothetical protein
MYFAFIVHVYLYTKIVGLYFAINNTQNYFLFAIQVYFVDIDVNEGKQVQKEFENEFGQGMAAFLELNVTDKETFEGKTIKTQYKRLNPYFFLRQLDCRRVNVSINSCVKPNITM